MEAETAPTLCMILTSPDPRGRSAAALALAAATARELGAIVHVLDASRWPLVPEGDDSPDVTEGRQRFAQAAGALFAGPIYDWSPAPQLLNAIAQVLDGEAPRYKPVAFLGGAGTLRSTLALSAAVQMVSTEIGAAVIGAPVIIAGDDVDRETGRLRPEVADRVRAVTRALVAYARTFAVGVSR